MSQLLLAGTFEIGYSALTTATIQASNGDYILAGRLFYEDNSSAAIAIRVRPDGMVVWENTYSADYSVFFQSITQLADGTVVATGSHFYSGVAGDEYIWAVRLDAMGKKIWEGTFGSKEEQNDGYAVTATADGGFIITGFVLDKATGQPGTWVLKFDQNCKLQWDKKFDGGIAFDVTEVRDGGYALSGAHNVVGSLNSNVYVLRLDGNGHKIWEKIYPDYEVYVLLESGISETDNGHFLVAAKSVLMEIDENSNIIWARQADNLSLNSIVQMPDGAYAVGGSLIVDDFDHAYVAVIDRMGEEILWDNTETLYPSGIAQILVNRDGYLTGGGYGPLNINQSLMFLAVFDPVKTVVFSR
jgi:hypothetical protein